MAEEKSIFSKLKPISINEDKSQNISLGKSQEQNLSIDLSLKNDITIIKEKILFLEKSIIDISKNSQFPTQNLKEEIISEIRKVLNQEVNQVMSVASKEISNLINEIVLGLKKELITYIKEEIKISSQKELQIIESLKNLSAKDFEKLEHISVKLDFIMKIYDKIKGFEDIVEWIRKDMGEEFKKITQRLTDASLRLESTVVDELSKNIEKATYDKLHEIRESIMKEFEIFQSELKEQMRKDKNSLSDDIININKRIDECKRCLDYFASLREKMTQPEVENLIREMKYLSESFRELKNKIHDDDEFKNTIFIKKYSVAFVDVEARLAKIENLLIALLNTLK